MAHGTYTAHDARGEDSAGCGKGPNARTGRRTRRGGGEEEGEMG